MKRRDIRQILATNLRLKMDATPGLDTQAKVAARAKISQSSVGRFLAGSVYAQLAQVETLAHLFGVSVAEMLNESGPTETSIDTLTFDRRAVAELSPEKKRQIEQFITFVVQQPQTGAAPATLEISETSDTPAGLKQRLLDAIERELDDTQQLPNEENEPSRPAGRRSRSAN
ncbi:helix-turn-helix domain-containing protein [Burkholderia gladioli]|uniref:helix-turn-helix domain-containing protein n=1 Tax=Burkholderia gladioli TaxID=28095 RepID=UPI00163F1AA0|nr:helix-turn-helix transcriptional regulator [Burkholderia gladioli]